MRTLMFWKYGIALLGLFLGISASGHAQEFDLEDAFTMKQRGQVSREAVEEPSFLDRNNPVVQQGVYFGVGFRSIRMGIRGLSWINNSDSTTNGVAFNLGYLWRDGGFEYTRHMSLLKLSRVRRLGSDRFNLVDAIHNNFQFFLFPKIGNDLHLSYGAGIQLTEIRLIFQDENPEVEASEAISNENAFFMSAGVAYFLTHNFFIQYRFTQANYSALLSGPGVDYIMSSVRTHTLFLQYYFSL